MLAKIMDYTDLETATADYVDKCNMLDKCLKTELEALRALKEKERKRHLIYFKKVEHGEMSNAMYKASIKNDTFDEELAYKEAKMNRTMAQNSEKAYKEKLYTLKRQINIQ